MTSNYRPDVSESWRIYQDTIRDMFATLLTQDLLQVAARRHYQEHHCVIVECPVAWDLFRRLPYHLSWERVVA